MMDDISSDAYSMTLIHKSTVIISIWFEHRGYNYRKYTYVINKYFKTKLHELPDSLLKRQWK